MLHIRKINLKHNNSSILWTICPADIYQKEWTIFDSKEKKMLNSFKNNQRKNEFITTRILLQSILPDAKIEYTKNGKPFLLDSKTHISISHSKQIISIIVSENSECAIDVQTIENKVISLRNKFLSEREMLMFPESDTTLNSIAWSVKETLFKSINQENVPYKTCLTIESFNNSLFNCLVNHENISKKLIVHYKVFDNFVMSYLY